MTGTRTDLRARLSVKGDYSTPFSGAGQYLRRTNGILFPYTPNINVQHQVEYNTYDTVHSNFQQNAFVRSRAPNIQLTANFAQQTSDEAQYLVGVMHFLRVVTKMNFGKFDRDAGTPPPVLKFSAYGQYNFSGVPVLVGSFNFLYDDNVDYVEVDIQGSAQPVQVPSFMTIAMDLLPQYSPSLQRGFTLQSFANGTGYGEGFL